jgi:hypothetical protein
MTLFTLVLFAPLEFEDDDFRPTTIFDNDTGHGRAVENRRTYSKAMVIARSQNLGELDCITGVFACQRRDTHNITWAHSKLFPAYADDCVCHYGGTSKKSMNRKPPIIGCPGKWCQPCQCTRFFVVSSCGFVRK